MGKDKLETPKKYYAQAINSGRTDLDTVCDEIAEQCALTSADVKAMLDRMNFILNKELRMGRIVQLGELGSFRLGVGSVGAEKEDDFHVAMIKKPKIIFTPGKKLQATRSLTKFERYKPIEEDSEKKSSDSTDSDDSEIELE